VLRPYQVQAIEAIRAQLRAGRRRVLLISPTGSGKSLLIASMVQGAIAKGKRALFVVHRRELVMQLSERLTMPHRVMMGRDSRGDASEPVVVASIQTIGRRDPPPADLILIDEAHRARADSYLRLLDRYPGVPVIGYTASPWRTDGRGLGDLFEANVVAATPAQLIRDGWLCGYRGFAFVAPDLSEVKTVAGDWDEKGLSLAYQRSTIYADIIEKWQKHAQGRQTIVFAASIENSLVFVAKFISAGARAAHLDYLTPATARVEILQRVRSGAIDVLSNVSLLGEGIDIPTLSCAILARPTKSLTVYLQQVGRVMRPKADGSKALILDHSSNVLRHGLPDAERCYDLTTTKPKEVVAALHICKSCFCIYEGGPTCPECAMVQPTVSRSGPEVSLAHVEVPLAQVRRSRDALVVQLAGEARARGRAPGWVVRELKSRMPGASFPAGWWRANVAGQKGSWSWR
jgi:superfamily II DNA or RNA helicase